MAGSNTTRASHDLGLHQVFPRDGVDDARSIDIVAIHGLDTGSPTTWLAYEFQDKNGTRGRSVNWLSDEDMLPRIIPEARIFTYDWNANYHTDAPVQTLLGQADNLLTHLSQRRKDDSSTSRPLIFIASCFGGLVLIEALNRAAQTGSPHLPLLSATVGVVFLATPLRGTRASPLVQWRVYVAGILGRQASDSLIRDLDAKTGVLKRMVQQFAENSNAPGLRLPLHCFYEIKQTQVLNAVLPRGISNLFANYTNFVLVEEDAACIDTFGRTGLDAAHTMMNKFRGPNDANFNLVSPVLRGLVDGASVVMAYRENHQNGTMANVHWTIPRPVNNLFIGRKDTLARIKRAFRENPNTAFQKRFVITGMGGQGKSEICLRIADEMRYFFWGIFWVDVSQPDVAVKTFLSIAKKLGHAAESFNDAKEVLSSTKAKWLLILDNADDDSIDYQVYIPTGILGNVLITSRVRDCDRLATVGVEVLPGLEDDDSKTLLLNMAKLNPNLKLSYHEDALTIVQDLGSHPLAVIQAGAYIACGYCQLHEYSAHFRQQRKRLLEFWPKQAQSRYGNVYATFEASAKVLEASPTTAAADALDILRIFSLLNFSELPLQLFEEAWRGLHQPSASEEEQSRGLEKLPEWHAPKLPAFIQEQSDEWDPFRLSEALNLLESLSLITRSKQGDFTGVSMHPLAHAWAKDRQSSNKQDESWVSAGSVIAYSCYQNDMWLLQDNQLRPHLQIFLNSGVKSMFSRGPRLMVAQILVRCLWRMSDMRDDLRLTSLIDGIFVELRIDPLHPSAEWLSIYSVYAGNSYYLGEFDTCVNLLGKILAIQDNMPARDHPSRLWSQDNLAGAYLANGEIPKAIDLFEHVVAIQEKTLATTHPDRLGSQHNLAGAYLANGEIPKAIDLFEHVVAIQEKTLATTHPDRLASQHELARAYLANGEIPKAIDLFEHVVAIQEKTLATTHPDRLGSQHNLAGAYRANGEIPKAIDLFEHVVAIQEKTPATTHPARLASQKWLVLAYRENGQLEEAASLENSMLIL